MEREADIDTYLAVLTMPPLAKDIKVKAAEKSIGPDAFEDLALNRH